MSFIDTILIALSNAALDETIHLTPDKHKKFKIMIRTRSGGGRADNPIRHSTSIKVTLPNGKNYSIPILARSYDGIERNNITKDAIRSMTDKHYAKFTESFIYDNQIAILAYWYLSELPDNVRQVFSDYFNQQIEDKFNAYYDGKINPKTIAEMETDKDTITNYVREKLKDPEFKLYFGATKGEKK